MKKVVCKAYGKVNLTLDVLGKRPDGYHEVLTVLQGISLHDLVSLEIGGSHEKGGQGIQLTCDIPQLSTGPENLAYRAAELLREDFPQLGGIKIHLTKRIPLAAGLAGGSADAAAVLLGLNSLAGLGLSLADLRRYAARLGSDVPFCLEPLTAIGKGRGERITECAQAPEIWLTLAKPPFNVATKDAYENLHKVTITNRPHTEKVLEGLDRQDEDLMYAHMGNVLEEATFDMYPELREWKKEMEELGAAKVLMSGSGPTLIGFFPTQEEAQKFAVSFHKPQWEIAVARTITRDDLAERVDYHE
ncbi:MAG: 4-(cytidine 5'-diphospho)-2-C-methyl-D-erythritol kinase [Peptococcia bacterium]|jgi:4-diphosphocytidyl-2-C-methyl-D-erythritol kinase